MPASAAHAPRRCPEPARKQASEQPGNDGDIETGDGNDVRRAGGVVGLAQVSGDPALDAEQDAGQQGSLRFGEDGPQHAVGAGAVGVDGAQQSVASAVANALDKCACHQAVDALACQVVAVVEVRELGWGLEQPGGMHKIAVCPAPAALGMDEHHAAGGGEPAALRGRPGGADAVRCRSRARPDSRPPSRPARQPRRSCSATGCRRPERRAAWIESETLRQR